MVILANGALFHITSPIGTIRGQPVPSTNRPGWSLIQVATGADGTPRFASMLPTGTFQLPTGTDGTYEQCLQRGNAYVFMPRANGEDQIVPAVFDLPDDRFNDK